MTYNTLSRIPCDRFIRLVVLAFCLVVFCCRQSDAFFFSFEGDPAGESLREARKDSSFGNPDTSSQCTGLTLDSTRFLTVLDENEYMREKIQSIKQQSNSQTSKPRHNTPDGLTVIQKRNVDIPSNQHHSRSSDSSNNTKDKGTGFKRGSISSVRLQATHRGITVHGAEIVATTTTTMTDECFTHTGSINNTFSNPYTCTYHHTTTKIHGRLFQNITLSSEQLALSTALLDEFEKLPTMTSEASLAAQDEARQAIAIHFEVTLKDVSSDMSLEIYPTPRGDYLAFFGDVLVTTQQTGGKGPQLFEVVVDAMDMTILAHCLVGSFDERTIPLSSKIATEHFNHRSLRTNIIHRDATPSGETLKVETNHTTLACGRCTESMHNGITWSSDDRKNVVSCPLQSLYLNNTEKRVPCISGVDSEGEQVFWPGPIHTSFWAGTYDCHSSTSANICSSSPFVQGCNDAMSDVQFVATRTMQFLEDHLGVLSGDVLLRNPEPIKAYVHYGTKYCNAMFRGREGILYFGDCDCQQAGAMVSLDIIAHEISHFLTWHSSRLASGYISGGLSEGYGDILGTIMEFVINDDFDEPDFTIGESTGTIMRSMEYPNTILEGLDSVCYFDIQNSTSVHATSGPLNKAFVLSVRACQQKGCAASITECVVLLGSIFQYSNLHKLSTYSGYLDAATASCESVNEFFLERSPNTTCSIDETYTFINDGWEGVNVVFEGSIDQCRARKQCQGGPSQSVGTKAFLTLTDILDRLLQMKQSMLHFH